MRPPWINDFNPIWECYPTPTNTLFPKRSKMHIGSDLGNLIRRLRRKNQEQETRKNQCPDVKFQVFKCQVS